MARVNMPEKVNRRRLGALRRFKMQPSRKGVQTLDGKVQEVINLKAKVERWV